MQDNNKVGKRIKVKIVLLFTLQSAITRQKEEGEEIVGDRENFQYLFDLLTTATNMSLRVLNWTMCVGRSSDGNEETVIT